ncbi:hypothetical protein OC835_004923, partial [Tilletia horrida]
MPDTFENRLRAQLAKERDVDKGSQQLETTKGISVDRQREHEEEQNSFLAHLRMLVLIAVDKGARSLNADDILAHSVYHMSETASASVYVLQPAGGSIYFGRTERFEARFKGYKNKKLPSLRMESAAEVVDVASWRVG